MKRILWTTIALVALTLTFSGCGATGGAETAPTATLPTAPAPPVTAGPTAPPSLAPVLNPGTVADLEAMLQSVYAKTNPSIVNLRVILAAGPAGRTGAAGGSGFVWDSQGHIVTNAHVVSGATRITVTFSDGTTVDGNLVGADGDSDLAVVKIAENAQVQPVTMGDSTQLKVGQLAVAIGNPFGLQGTMTVGFVSGLGRLLPTNVNGVGASYSIPDVVQTDAPINPGNSGGVLLDSSGRVIGVTSSIASTSGTNAGVGFAIPSAIVRQVVPSLIKTGRYDHPYLGISVSSLDPDLAAAMSLPPGQRGALVQTVTAGGPADRAGLQGSNTRVTINGQQATVGGDVIIAYGDQTVKGSDDLITFMARSGSVGQTVTLTVLRGGRRVQVPATLGLRPTQ